MQRRYESLQLHHAITRRGDYVEACKELRGILKAVYAYAAKPLQALIYDDILHAFRYLPRMETSQQLAAGRGLLQTVEDSLPKQRRSAAAHEFKIAMIAWHRQFKNPASLPEKFRLPGDLMLHVFGFLDARSLATASMVSREWKIAAKDDTLWRPQFLSLFETSHLSSNVLKSAGVSGVSEGDGRLGLAGKNLETQQGNSVGIWRKAFDVARQGRSSRLFMSNRAYCPVCKEVIWLNEPSWKPVKGKCVAKKQVLDQHSVRPMSLGQVVSYIVSRDVPSPSVSSSSDSDEEDEEAGRSFFRSWNVPKTETNLEFI